MIHTIHTMTVGRYGKLDATGDARLLKRWFNPLPVGWFTNKVERFFDDVREVFDAEDKGNRLYEGGERLYDVNRLLKLSILYDALSTILLLQGQVHALLLAMGKKPVSNDNAQYFKDEVKELTGIEIKGLNDLNKLKAELTRLSDKFKERYPDEKPSDEKHSFAKTTLNIFAVMEMPYNDRMTMYEFGELRKLADLRIKEFKKIRDKHGSTR